MKENKNITDKLPGLKISPNMVQSLKDFISLIVPLKCPYDAKKIS